MKTSWHDTAKDHPPMNAPVLALWEDAGAWPAKMTIFEGDVAWEIPEEAPPRPPDAWKLDKPGRGLLLGSLGPTVWLLGTGLLAGLLVGLAGFWETGLLFAAASLGLWLYDGLVNTLGELVALAVGGVIGKICGAIVALSLLALPAALILLYVFGRIMK